MLRKNLKMPGAIEPNRDGRKPNNQILRRKIYEEKKECGTKTSKSGHDINIPIHIDFKSMPPKKSKSLLSKYRDSYEDTSENFNEKKGLEESALSDTNEYLA
jgi:hypothetical protein